MEITSVSGYVSTGDVESNPVQMNFKDGTHTVSGPIVAHLGGTAVLLANIDLFKEKTYQEFMGGFWKLVERDNLNRAFETYKNNYLDMQSLFGRI